MNYKKVLYIGGFVLPDRNAAAQRVIANAKLFRDLGYEVELLGLSDNKSEANNPFEYEGFSCMNLPYPKGFNWIFYLNSIKQYKPLFETRKPDLVIAYNFPAFALRKLIKYGKNYNVKVIGDVTEWYVPGGNVIFRNVKGADIHYRMEVFQPKMDGLIVISKYLENYYTQRGVKTLLLPPLVDKKEEKWNVRQEDATREIKFMYAGTGSKKDRLDFIIDALDRIQNEIKRKFTLKIMGSDAKKFCALYNRKESEIPPFVSFLGRISHKEVLYNLKNSDFQIFVRQDTLANRAGFPTKFVESISSGTLVLTNLSSDLRDYMLEDSLGFTLEIDNQDSLYKSLKRVFDVPYDALCEMRRKINSNMFDYRLYVENTKEFLKSI